MPSEATGGFMQVVEVEREAHRRLPRILDELLHAPEPVLIDDASDGGNDLIVDADGRRWVMQVKASSSPGLVAAAAQQLARTTGEMAEGLPVLVVPYMTASGARAADERDLSWVDLSGNAHLHDGPLHAWVLGRPNAFAGRGRPASAFAPRSSRVACVLLLDPWRWWRQKELSERTGLDAGRVSRVVARLTDLELLERQDLVIGHLSGTGTELAHDISERLTQAGIDHAFTGLPAAWALDRWARFRLVSLYVDRDPRAAADLLGLRRNERGANVQQLRADGSLWGERR